MKFKNTLKTAGHRRYVALWSARPQLPENCQPPQRTLQEQEPLWHKTLTPEDADLLRELQIVVDPAEVLQPGEKTPGRQILETFWAEDR